MESYYVDSCIYLNLWKKEVEDNGRELWKIALEFFKKVEEEGAAIYFSGFLLKELMFILSTEEYITKRELFETSPNFKKVFLSKEEFNGINKIKKDNPRISTYDIIHMLIAKKTDSILITRDKLLLELSKKYSVMAKKPEEL